MAGPYLFYNLFSPSLRTPVTSIWPRVVRASCVWRVDNQTAPFVSRFHFAERYNASVDLTSESGHKNDGEAEASGCAYKNCQFSDHVSLRYSFSKFRLLSLDHALCVSRHSLSERTGDQKSGARWCDRRSRLNCASIRRQLQWRLQIRRRSQAPGFR